jgi:hypothetical protein
MRIRCSGGKYPLYPFTSVLRASAARYIATGSDCRGEPGSCRIGVDEPYITSAGQGSGVAAIGIERTHPPPR